MNTSNPYQPPVVADIAPAAKITFADPEHEGIRGWLILVGFGVAMSPFLMLRDLIRNYKSVFSDGTWDQLTTPGAAGYHAFWGPLLGAEMLINTCMLALWMSLVYLFFAKRKAFPKWYIRAQVAGLVILIADACALQVVRPDLPLLDPETRKELIRSGFAVCVWVPYMLISKRVAATFRH